MFKNISQIAQKEIKTIKGIKAVLVLDEALWSATGASIDNINCDTLFIQYMDIDHNSRIMCFEVKEAINWTLKNLTSTGHLLEASDILSLDDINTDHQEGRDIIASASQILERLNNSRERKISLAQIRSIKEKLLENPVSEAGVVLPEAATDTHKRRYLSDIVATVGGIPHPSGKSGVNSEKLNEFIESGTQYLSWFKKGMIPENEQTTPIMPLGMNTHGAYRSYAAVREKIDQYFHLCALISFSRQMGIIDPSLSREAEDTLIKQKLPDFRDPQKVDEFLEHSPIAMPSEDCQFCFDSCINLFFKKAIRDFKSNVFIPIIGDTAKKLTEDAWNTIKQTFIEYEAWQKEKAGEIVASIEADVLETYLEPGLITSIKNLIAESNETALVLDEIRHVEKLVLYQRWLLTFLNNFVYFPYLYDPEKRAMFEMGTLIIDGRRFNLSVRVDNHEKHRETSGHSNMYVLYVAVRSAKEIKYEVAVPVTSGGKGNLYIGKRGIFQDIHGQDWDAEITDIVENPISLYEALIRPFKNFAKLINSKIEEIKSVAESKLGSVVKENKVDTGTQPPLSAPPREKIPDGKSPGLGNFFMGGSIAIAALGSGFAFITKTLSEVQWYTIVFTLLGGLLAVLIPTFISAFIKLKKRDMTTILEASGWAINVRMNLTFQLGKFFTSRPKPPLKVRRYKLILFVIIIVILAGCVTGFIFILPYLQKMTASFFQGK